MGFQAPILPLADYLNDAFSGRLQLPDFQRGYRWDDERIRALLVTVLRGHPLGVVMLLKTGNDQIRFKPRPVQGRCVQATELPNALLLDGQQRITSLTQALKGDGVVDTMDARGKLLQRCYYLDLTLALEADERLDEAVRSLPADGIVRSNFGRDIDLDVSTPDLQRAHKLFPLNLLFGDSLSWLLKFEDFATSQALNARFLQPIQQYGIPAIQLDNQTSRAAVATVFEKVNTGGLPLTVFELLTATFAGDPTYFHQHGTDFRLNDDWEETRERFTVHPVLHGLENTDFLQAVTLLTTHQRHVEHRRAGHTTPPPAISAKREDVLKLSLSDYLTWAGPLRDAFEWTATFLADRHIFDTRFVPYPKQLVPLAVLKVLMGQDAQLQGPGRRLVQWFWCGILGELYGSTIATRFVRDIEQVPGWATSEPGAAVPSTVADANFVESRLYSLRTRNAAAYKGIYALLLGNGAREWMQDKALDKVQYVNLAVDIHHVFPQRWCVAHKIEDERRESIVNKTAISAATNRSIGGDAPSKYLQIIEAKAQISAGMLDKTLEAHLIPAAALRADDFDRYFRERRERLCRLIETAMGKDVYRDMNDDRFEETSAEFEEALVAETVEERD